MVVDVGHEKLPEVPDNRTADTLIRDPLGNGLGLDIAELLEGNFLREN